MRKHLTTIIFILVFLTGLSLMLYPTVSNYWNTMHQSRAITGYARAAAELDDAAYDRILSAAHAYNDRLSVTGSSLTLQEEDREEYLAQLDISGQGIMGYIEIPQIDCRLPIYHGTDEGVLQVAVGHIEGSSLPVGGADTHCVLSGHRGLPSARLFTDLDQMKEGDLFTLHVMDEVMTYEVDQILVVLPEEVDALAIRKGEDLCTLVTCTPYGVNSHRMLVRGSRRIENRMGEGTERITADAMQIEKPLVVSAAAVPALILLLIPLACIRKKRERSVSS